MDTLLISRIETFLSLGLKVGDIIAFSQRTPNLIVIMATNAEKGHLSFKTPSEPDIELALQFLEEEQDLLSNAELFLRRARVKKASLVFEKIPDELHRGDRGEYPVVLFEVIQA